MVGLGNDTRVKGDPGRYHAAQPGKVGLRRNDPVPRAKEGEDRHATVAPERSGIKIRHQPDHRPLRCGRRGRRFQDPFDARLEGLLAGRVYLGPRATAPGYIDIEGVIGLRALDFRGVEAK